MQFHAGSVCDYQTAADYLSSGRDANDRPFGNNTRLLRIADDAIGVKYHATVILVWRADGTIILNTNGWHTTTTAYRLNALLPAGWRIGSDRGRWYLFHANGRMVDVRFGATMTRWDRTRFSDGMEIRPDGTLGNVPAVDVLEAAEKAEKTTERAIGRYVRAFTRAMAADEIPMPGLGDCLICRIPDLRGAADTDHLESHLDEQYLVPTLAINAMAERGYNLAVWFTESATGHLQMTFDRDGATLGRAIRRYLKARLLPELAR